MTDAQNEMIRVARAMGFMFRPRAGVWHVSHAAMSYTAEAPNAVRAADMALMQAREWGRRAQFDAQASTLPPVDPDEARSAALKRVFKNLLAAGQRDEALERMHPVEHAEACAEYERGE
ncbi:hypothetical protein H1O16_gp036 [Burkholderia phage BcepSaruman]|uniref:Uncharacterized protein n=1 Tax=Burkholderia phage BcepSaruman TaxID=2530032 RepID=A0A4D5ZCP2_9CAUD|nr:hypothetical protein H1O16_gp036 [Burkholderia phage BcepSaruman]QBX06449.1 hypothetical protein BcepSaruman_036 [Burkholderia phage BcepSaruman]